MGLVDKVGSDDNDAARSHHKKFDNVLHLPNGCQRKLLRQ